MIRNARFRSVCLLFSVSLLMACEGDMPGGAEPPAPIPAPSPFEYPVDLWEQQAEGETMLLVHVTEIGDVDSVSVDMSSGFPAFDSAAVRGAHKLKFSPARQGDLRIPAWTRVPVRFRVDSMDTMGTAPEGGQ